MGKSLSEEITRQAPGIAVHVITREEDEKSPCQLGEPSLHRSAWPCRGANRGGGAILLGMLAAHWLNVTSISMIFLGGAPLRRQFRLLSAVIAALLSFFAYNFFSSSQSTLSLSPARMNSWR